MSRGTGSTCVLYTRFLYTRFDNKGLPHNYTLTATQIADLSGEAALHFTGSGGFAKYPPMLVFNPAIDKLAASSSLRPGGHRSILLLSRQDRNIA